MRIGNETQHTITALQLSEHEPILESNTEANFAEMEMMKVIGELHAQIDTSRRNLAIATEAGLPHEAHLHRARLQDLFAIATRYGIDVTPWVDATAGAETRP
jgi:hypothetical protein